MSRIHISPSPTSRAIVEFKGSIQDHFSPPGQKLILESFAANLNEVLEIQNVGACMHNVLTPVYYSFYYDSEQS